MVRNYCKRICREVFRKQKAYFKKNYDLFVIIKRVPEDLKVLFRELEKALEVFIN